MDYLSSNKILIVDLETGQISEDDLDDELVGRKIGGVGITSSLYQTHKDKEPIVLGTGLLTGTMFPASALGVVSAKSPNRKPRSCAVYLEGWHGAKIHWLRLCCDPRQVPKAGLSLVT